MSGVSLEVELHGFGCRVLGEGHGRALTALSALVRDESLEALLLQLYGAQLMPAQRPVLVSQWAKYLFGLLITPVLVAILTRDWHWPLRLDHLAIAVDERGLPDGLLFVEAGSRRVMNADEPLQAFDALLDDLLTPLITRLGVYGELPRAVLWSSAGEALDACLRCLEASLAERGRPLLEQARRSDGRRNPLYRSVVHVPRYQRRACCLSHRVAWVGRCEHCPLPIEAPAKL
ncbi:siderophore-iron reductase FhuF [uncultured Pseudomonas sp.]|uniref:siderophore-iron reductase FhuF n=1 Tax=uncultured Pseudomonas sp. TaxID=114707 RepID=UPI002600F348|nr:siderophore-iron reductase FhuF [uncultured Pseudomonas sp.]